MSESESLSAFEDAVGVACCSCAAATGLLRSRSVVSFKFFVAESCCSLRCLFHSSDIERIRAASSVRQLPTEAPSQCSWGTRRPFCDDERYCETKKQKLGQYIWVAI